MQRYTEVFLSDDFFHSTVLLEEALDALDVRSGRTYCDATLGGGGHSEQILLRSAPDGQLIAIDRDRDALTYSAKRLETFGKRATLVHGNFRDIDEILDTHNIHAVDGILADLGISSHQVDTPQRGFSFAHAGPLDMRLDATADLTAEQLIDQLSEQQLADVIYHYGEERHSRRIARTIRREREAGRLTDTKDLADVVAQAARRGSSRRQQSRRHPATKTFQALRIAVNDELAALERFIKSAFASLKVGGRLVVISFHSLEDRRVKQAFASLAGRPVPQPEIDLSPTAAPELPDCDPPRARLIQRKVIKPSDQEVAQNPRARSAKLRALEKLR